MEHFISLVYDGLGNAKERNPPSESISHHAQNGFIWTHLERDHPDTVQHLHRFGLEDLVVEALMADETRPRFAMIGNGAFVNLRGVNLNPGSEPEDMVSVRLWITHRSIIGVWLRPLKATRDLRENSLKEGFAPTTTGEFVAFLANSLVERTSPIIDALANKIDGLEEITLVGNDTPRPNELSDIRRMATRLTRYLFPQRQALEALSSAKLEWLLDHDRSQLKEAADKVVRLAEDLEAIRLRAQVLYDEIQDRRAASMNQHTFVLSVVGAIFLPLGFLTGLLGINVGGIPGTENESAFWIVCGLLVLIAGLLFLVFRRIGMLR